MENSKLEEYNILQKKINDLNMQKVRLEETLKQKCDLLTSLLKKYNVTTVTELQEKNKKETEALDKILQDTSAKVAEIERNLK